MKTLYNLFEDANIVGIFQAISEQPNNRQNYLVAGDWFEDQDDLETSEFIRGLPLYRLESRYLILFKNDDIVLDLKKYSKQLPFYLLLDNTPGNLRSVFVTLLRSHGMDAVREGGTPGSLEISYNRYRAVVTIEAIVFNGKISGIKYSWLSNEYPTHHEPIRVLFNALKPFNDFFGKLVE